MRFFSCFFSSSVGFPPFIFFSLSFPVFFFLLRLSFPLSFPVFFSSYVGFPPFIFLNFLSFFYFSIFLLYFLSLFLFYLLNSSLFSCCFFLFCQSFFVDFFFSQFLFLFFLSFNFHSVFIWLTVLRTNQTMRAWTGYANSRKDKSRLFTSARRVGGRDIRLLALHMHKRSLDLQSSIVIFNYPSVSAFRFGDYCLLYSFIHLFIYLLNFNFVWAVQLPYTWRLEDTCSHSDSCEKPSAIAAVRNTQSVIWL